MASESFSTCFLNYVGDVGQYAYDEVRALPTEGVKNFLNWWHSLATQDQALILFLAGIAVKVVESIIVKAVGPSIAGFICGVSVALCVRAFMACEDKL